jgi:Zn-dependent protease
MGPRGTPPPPGTELERLRATVALYFPVYETRITPVSLILLVQVDPATLEDRFDRLRRELWDQYYVPQVRKEGGEYLIEVIRRPQRTAWGSVTNVVLLAITMVTTILAGGFLWVAYIGGTSLTLSAIGYGALYFGFPLLAILGCHELAHFVMARRHHVEASLPFFIPVPPPFLLFGTFGAFISLREPIPSKKALLDIGASGPLAGFAVAIPVTLAGLFLSEHAPVLSVANCGPMFLGFSYGNLIIGRSIVLDGLSLFFPSSIVSLQPLALAGWVGLLVTAINLLPAGQLDGGHVFRALFGDRSRYASYVAVGVLVVLGLGLAGPDLFYPGWLIFAILIFVLGMRHPPPLNDLTPLDLKRYVVGAVVAAVLVSGFIVVPIGSPSGSFGATASPVAPTPGAAGMTDTTTLSVTNHDLVPHGYVVSGAITGVTAAVNGTAVPLSGAALAEFLANSTWRVDLANRNMTVFAGSGEFSVPTGEYSALNATESGSFTIIYENPEAAVVTATLSVDELCAEGASPTQSFTVTMS